MLGTFCYHNPTKLYFGKESLAYLQEELPKYGKNVLLIYGGGSIKKNGLYDAVTELLKKHEKNIAEVSGVMSNPTLEKLYEGRKIAREQRTDFILAVGGGSVCDYAKAVAASARTEEDPWEKFYLRMEKADETAIPVGCILTMAGTGSEMNDGSVITNEKTKLKICAAFGEWGYPRFAVLNPEFTFTLPQYQMVSGIFDIMSHLLEQYFSGEDDNTSDYITEGLLKSLIHSAEIAVKEPRNYEARSNIMWTASWALNTLVEKGKTTDWMVHSIGHSISAYTGATHGMTLAAVSLPYYRHILPYGLAKFKRYAINVWNVDTAGKSDLEIAENGLQEMEHFMQKIGVVLHSSELGVREEMLESIADGVFILDGGYKTLNREEIIAILRESL